MLDEQNKSIHIQSRYRDETYIIVRTILNEEDLAVYSCETRFPGGRLVRYVVKYDPNQMVVVLYPENPYLKASTTFQLIPE
ncbi:hypothetical protein [Pontibacter saemangeumensis]|uniref:hypothetical protein n=1 Tax=Pontibacter saemangeumensis TaxID=1084525 RepID=UPI0031F13C7A